MIDRDILTIVLPTASAASVILTLYAVLLCCIYRRRKARWNAQRCNKIDSPVIPIDDQVLDDLLSNEVNSGDNQDDPSKEETSKSESLHSTETLTSSTIQDIKDCTGLMSDDVSPSEEETSNLEEPLLEAVETSAEEASYLKNEPCNVDAFSKQVSSYISTQEAVEMHTEESNNVKNESTEDVDAVKPVSNYISMDRHVTGVRRCHTFCGAPSEPYLINEFVDNNSSLLSHQSIPGLDVPDSSRYSSTGRPVPVGRCSPFRTKENIDDESEMTKTKNDRLVPVYDMRKFVAQTMPSSVNYTKRKIYPDDVDLNEHLSASFSDYSEDLFKEAWWRSSLSINSEDLLKDDLKRPSRNIRHSASRPSSHASSIYVRMEVGRSPHPCRPPSEKRGRSTTMPNVFGGYPRDSFSGKMPSPCVSVWYPQHLSGNLEFTAEICPRPCAVVPHYVNFRGTLPKQF